MTDDGLVDIDCLYAAVSEPLLKGHHGNARRQANLERIRGYLQPKEGEGHLAILEFLGYMKPDSVPAAWERLFRMLEKIDPNLAALAESECRMTRAEIWGAMRTGADMVPHLTPICRRFDERRHGALMDMREELYTVLSSTGESFQPGPEMQTYIANFARFGSRADDEMTKLIVDELYIRRGLLEEACGICEEILEFDGFDRDRMAASTLFEDILIMVLGGLEDRGKKGRGLAGRCASLLKSRSDQLGLGIRPNPDDSNALRALAGFASSISARRRIYPAEELGRHIGQHYPKSHKFLGLDKASNLREMAEKRSPLAANMSVSIASQKIAADRKIPYEGGNALMHLEPMLGALETAGMRASVLGRWSRGIRGRQLWECLFEMEMYLRLVLAGTSATVDKEVNGKEVDLEFGGCLAEVYSPLESEVLVPGHVVTVEDPGTDFMRRVLAKEQLGSVGNRETVLIVECPPGMYPNVAYLGKKMRSLLGRHRQPGGVLFVRGDSSPRRNYVFLENPVAVTPVSDGAKRALERALDLDLPQELS